MGILGVLGACQSGSSPQPVTLYPPSYLGSTTPSAVPAACMAAPKASALAAYVGTGDFEPPAEQSPLPQDSSEVTPIGLPKATRSILVNIHGSVWEGVSLVPASGPVNVLTLPGPGVDVQPMACPLAINAGSLGSAAGPSMGMIDGSHALIVGGQSVPAFVVDLGTGELTAPSPTLQIPRDDASVTSFGTGALVAGGTSSRGSESSAEIYESPTNGGIGGFTKKPPVVPLLGGSRSKHGAVALANGNVLLVGGEGQGGTALNSVELFEVGQPSSSLLPDQYWLKDARVSPTVLRLPTGTRIGDAFADNVFVGGGVGKTGPVSTVEWLSGDSPANFSRLAYYVDLCSPQSPLVACCPLVAPPAFAPLDGGAVLVVLGIERPFPKGCASNVGVVTTGAVQAAELPQPAAAPRLFAGAESRPVLFGDSGAVRWNPWSNEFDSSLGTGAEGLSAPVTMASPDPGLALWLGGDSSVWALRFDVRNIYSTDEPGIELLQSDASEFAPDRLAEVSASNPDVAFDPVVGLILQHGAGAFLTDATFADVSIDLEATGQLSLALLDRDSGQEFDYDLRADCLDSPFQMGQALHIERRGSEVSAGLMGTATKLTCSSKGLGASERVSVGFRGFVGTVNVTNVSVQRLGSPD